ncbi:MAG: alkene reductase [Bacteroidales bacterium]|nr:alkene reductase [Bacteroidales bacterium]
MSKKPPLLKSVIIGRYTLRNRVIMAPLTRRRATDGHVPTELMKTYYQQRASSGLIIAEATNISPQAVGYMNSPGIYTREQVDAWKPITEAVHKKGGVIFLQLWHVGRVSHPLLQPGNNLPVSSSPIKADGTINTLQGQKMMVTPKALEIKEISQIIEDYRQAAMKAMDAGFDGVEIHGANGYLPDQFLHDGSNTRSDEYGGNIKNRCRFILEITKTCCNAIGSDRVGIRLSPSGIYKNMFDSDPVGLYDFLVNNLNGFDLAYLHLMEPYVALDPPEKYTKYLKVVTPHYRKIYKGILISNVNYDYESANRLILENIADAVAFGKLFISNPDLVERFKTGASLIPWNEDTFYYGGEKGYIDYPSL